MGPVYHRCQQKLSEKCSDVPHTIPLSTKIFRGFCCIAKNQSQSIKYLRFWIPSDLVFTLARDVIQSCRLVGRVDKNCQSSINIREAYCFLARESSDEDVVYTIACAVETTIDASPVLSGASTWKRSRKHVVIVKIPIRRDNSSHRLEHMWVVILSFPIYKGLTKSTTWFLYSQHWFYATV